MSLPRVTYMSILRLTVLLFVLSACTPVTEQTTRAPSVGEGADVDHATREFPTVHSEYVQMPYEDMVQEADYIVAATVISISDTSWNQDSGEYWEERTSEGEYSTDHRAMPVYTIQLTVDKAISGEIKDGESISITSTGISPNQRTSDNEIYQDFIDLVVGDQLIGFLENGIVAWRDPSRPIELALTDQGDQYVDIGTRDITGWLVGPTDTFLIKQDDGLYHSQEYSSLDIVASLDELTTQIREMKEGKQ